MNSENASLEKVRIKNYLSLHDVELPLKPLTILVGPNASGKSNVDEDGTNETDYQSRKLALTSAGDYGIKPVTQALNQFIRNWKFYDFAPEMIRSENIELAAGKATGGSLDERGEDLRDVLSDWHSNANENFQGVIRDFELYSKFRINASRNGEGLSFFEGYSKPIPSTRFPMEP